MNVAVYMEGGGHNQGTRTALRLGMEAFLAEIKTACQERNWGWKLICCGPRNEAYQRFQNACKSIDAGIVVLLVDSESEVDESAPAEYLTTLDGWNFHDVDGDRIHLMVQTMETWIVADAAALKAYYGRGFREDVLPQHQNLEDVSKGDIEQALSRATQGTQRGKYHKIRHARQLLQRMNPITVRRQCRHCERLFETLLGLIAE